MLETKDLIDLTHTLAAPILEDKKYPWEALPLIKEFILALGPTLDPEVYENKGEGIWIAKSAKVFDSAYIAGPCIIGPETEVRHVPLSAVQHWSVPIVSSAIAWS